VAGGWQFDIPRASRPAEGHLTVYATVESGFLKGQQAVKLDQDLNPAITLRLAKDATAEVRGIVVDGSNRALAGARVSVVGYESEAVTTGANGGFRLPAHAAEGQQVSLHAEKAGYDAVTQFHPAGDEAATIVLGRR
jgi:Carboxypeptidase regulatory-like domain